MTGGIPDTLKPIFQERISERYSFNFEGNGFRYLLQELMIMIRDKRTECTRLFYDESVRIIEILETINRKDNS